MRDATTIIGEIDIRLSELKGLLQINSVPAAEIAQGAQGDNRFTGLAGEIFNLVEDGFFNEPRELSEIRNKLRSEGINKPRTTLMKPLLTLIRKKVLSRDKSLNGKGAFKYSRR